MLCPHCRQLKLRPGTEPARTCGDPADRQGMKWCRACAEHMDVCERCGQDLHPETGAETVAPPTPKKPDWTIN